TSLRIVCAAPCRGTEAPRQGRPRPRELTALTPARLGGVVLGAGLDPALARGCLLALPERRVGLQPIDQKAARRKRRLAVRRRGRDQHDAVAGFEPPVTMDDQSGGEWPAAVRLGLDLGELALGHAGIMFERHRRDAVGAASLKIEVAHEANKAR